VSRLHAPDVSLVDSGSASSDREIEGVGWRIRVGIAAHRLIAGVLEQGIRPAGPLRTAQLLEGARRACGDLPGGAIGRGLVLEVASSAACYILLFLPPPPWSFEGSEFPLGGGKADLVFSNSVSGRWVIDEVKTMLPWAGPEGSHASQIDRYLRAGAARWGRLFIGVRLCMVNRPTASLIYRAGAAGPSKLDPTWETDSLDG